MKVNSLSAEEVATQAGNLYEHWQTMQLEKKRELIEVIADKIVVGKEKITINLCYAPSCEEMAKKWRKGSLLNPFCHLVIRAIRWDSPRLGGEAKTFTEQKQSSITAPSLRDKIDDLSGWGR